MYRIECQRTEGITVGKWFRIWESEDGADTARYLMTCVLNEQGMRRQDGATCEYRMVYEPTTVPGWAKPEKAYPSEVTQ